MPVFDSLTTRIPNGVTNAAPWQTMGAAGTPDPSWSHLYHNDFDTFNAADWSFTRVGTGTAALTPNDGGTLTIANTAGAADSTVMQLSVASFLLKQGKAAFFKFAGTLSEVTNNTTFIGLAQAGATSYATITDGIGILDIPGSSLLNLVSIRGGVATTRSFPVPEVYIAGVPFELGLSVDAQGNLAAFFNPTTGFNPISASASAIGQSRGRVAALYGIVTPQQATPNVLTQVLLAPFVAFTNATAVTRTLLVDYITVSRER